MATDIISKIEREQMRKDVTPFHVGDTIKVHCRVVEGGKERIQLFAGICIARRGALVNESFTVRKIASGNINRRKEGNAVTQLNIIIESDERILNMHNVEWSARG